MKCTSKQSKQVWELKAGLYGLHLDPRSWHQTTDLYLIGTGFMASSADPCLYNKNNGGVSTALRG